MFSGMMRTWRCCASLRARSRPVLHQRRFSETDIVEDLGLDDDTDIQPDDAWADEGDDEESLNLTGPYRGDTLKIAEPRRRPKLPSDQLTKNQERAVKAALRGENVFIGGGIGTGKTETLLQIMAALDVEELEEGDDQIADVDGCDWIVRNRGVVVLSSDRYIHSDLGANTCADMFGLLPKSVSYRYDTPEMWVNWLKVNRIWNSAKVLILDDIHRIDFDQWIGLRLGLGMLRQLEEGGARNDANKNFAGMQIIATGDFLATEQGGFGNFGEDHGNMAFEDPDWNVVFGQNQFELEGQNNKGTSWCHEKEWGELLARWRLGQPSQADVRVLRDRQVDPSEDEFLSYALTKQELKRKRKREALKDPLIGRCLVVPEVNVPKVSRDTSKQSRFYLAGTDRSLMGGKEETSNRATTKVAADEEESESNPSRVAAAGTWRSYPIRLNCPWENPKKQWTANQCNLAAYAVYMKALSQILERYWNALNLKKTSAFYPHQVTYKINQTQGKRKKMTIQTFAVGDEVEAVITSADGSLQKGTRGLVVDVQPNVVSVDFGKGPVAVKRIVLQARKSSPLVEGPGVLELWVFPLEIGKFTLSEDTRLVSPDGPRVLVDMRLMDTGSYRSLYGALAHAHSADRLDIVGAIALKHDDSKLRSQLGYPRAQAFHLAMLGSRKVFCPVCQDSVSGRCKRFDKAADAGEALPEEAPPTEPLPDGPSVGELPIINWCARSYRWCKIDHKVVRHEDWSEHEHQVRKVRCQCGALLLQREVWAHRKKYAKDGPEGIKCYGPQASKVEPGSELTQRDVMHIL
eukprot:Hpha_TRINITY_DN22823_c0_g1::TRINITY_DN22823_c0_g1_i1::g.84327::m.84327